MDGIHDLGGMEGFGPVPVTFGQNEFTQFEDWEKRMTGLSYTLPVEGMTIDWFRHVVERMVPQDYLSFPYFNKWCATYMVMLIDNGVVDVVDLARAKNPSQRTSPSIEDVAAVLDENRSWEFSFEAPSETSPAFAVGQDVRARSKLHSGHHRLPRYVRGVEGRIIGHNGRHPLPDKSAKGEQDSEHLYTVRFSALALWGPEANSNDSVALDLWESYLVPA